MQISEAETPLHRLETVYRRLVERIATADSGEGAFRGIVDGWSFYALERDVLEDTSLDRRMKRPCSPRPRALMEARLASVTRPLAFLPRFAPTAARFKRTTTPMADGLMAWLSGQPTWQLSIRLRWREGRHRSLLARPTSCPGY